MIILIQAAAENLDSTLDLLFQTSRVDSPVFVDSPVAAPDGRSLEDLSSETPAVRCRAVNDGSITNDVCDDTTWRDHRGWRWQHLS